MTDSISQFYNKINQTTTITSTTSPVSSPSGKTVSAWQANGEANPAFFLPGLNAPTINLTTVKQEATSPNGQKPKKHDSGVSGDSHSEHSDSNDKNEQSSGGSAGSPQKRSHETANVQPSPGVIGTDLGGHGGKKVRVENTDESSEENINVDVVGSCTEESDSDHQRHSNAESNDMSSGSSSLHHGLQQFHTLLANHTAQLQLPMNTARQRLFAQAEKQRRRTNRKEKIKSRLDELMKQVRYLQREYNKADGANSTSSTESESCDEQAVSILNSIALPGFETSTLEKLIKKEINNVLLRVKEQINPASLSYKSSSNGAASITPDTLSPTEDNLSKTPSPTPSGQISPQITPSRSPTAAEALLKAQVIAGATHQVTQSILPQIQKLAASQKLSTQINNQNQLQAAQLQGAQSSLANNTLTGNTTLTATNSLGNMANLPTLTAASHLASTRHTSLQGVNSPVVRSLSRDPLAAQNPAAFKPLLTPTTPNVSTSSAAVAAAAASQAQRTLSLNVSPTGQMTSSAGGVATGGVTAANGNQQTSQASTTGAYAAYLQAAQKQQQHQTQQIHAQQAQQAAVAQQAAIAQHQSHNQNANVAATQAYQQAYQKALLAAKLSQAQAAHDTQNSLLRQPQATLPGLMSAMTPNRLSSGFGLDMGMDAYSGYDLTDIYGNIHKEGLTPHHLKKAKLMFFYNRYPSSSILKTFFTDVRFNRATTSQLIKWFSNFREFFYIHIEKTARQAVTEGIPQADDVKLTRDSELIRVLNNHYNKSNQFEVPLEFVNTAQLALKEFFNAIRDGKDQDPSWKKVIYKVICKLDSDVPSRFKAPQLAELGD